MELALVASVKACHPEPIEGHKRIAVPYEPFRVVRLSYGNGIPHTSILERSMNKNATIPRFYIRLTK